MTQTKTHEAAKQTITEQAGRAGLELVRVDDAEITDSTGTAAPRGAVQTDYFQRFELTRGDRQYVYDQPYAGNVMLPGSHATSMSTTVPTPVTLLPPPIVKTRNKVLLLVVAALPIPLSLVLFPAALVYLVWFNRPRWAAADKETARRLNESRALAAVVENIGFRHNLGGSYIDFSFAVQITPNTPGASQLVYRVGYDKGYRWQHEFDTMLALEREVAVALAP